ncbi:hypothetical protein I4U23_003808 [Adineta vaga]|nr:hypothetical protein I4U23_003808 [Adineta vaga]
MDALQPFHCLEISTFRCEEYQNRYRYYFSCSDGSYIEQFLPHFALLPYNYRGLYMSSEILLRVSLTDTNNLCINFTTNCSLQWFAWPEYPTFFGFFQFVYFNNRSIADFEIDLMPDLLCFNASQCPALLFCIEDFQINNRFSCCRRNRLIEGTIDVWHSIVFEMFKDLILRCRTIGSELTCSDSSLFHCPKSFKCISKHRLADGEIDCYFREDELYPACQLNDTWRFHCSSETNKCLSFIALEDKRYDCQNGEDELTIYERDIQKGNVPFALFCDEYNDIKRTNFSNDTDETHCNQWPCDTPYVRCNHVWNCLNGIDELNCPDSKCSLNEHICVTEIGFGDHYCTKFSQLKEFYWHTTLSSTFERKLSLISNTYINSTNYFLWNKTKCITSKHLLSHESSLPIEDNGVCLLQTQLPPAFRIVTYVENNFFPTDICVLVSKFSEEPIKKRFLQTSKLSNYPAINTTHNNNNNTLRLVVPNPKVPYIFLEPSTSWYCNRGISIRFSINKTIKCFCPPSYFGERCQWQNQRVSLTFQLIYRMNKFSTPVFQIMIFLMNEQRKISSYYEQMIYISKQDCDKKFNLYLLYPDQPKNSSANYSIHIDIYDKITLTYWASWYLPIPFQFLPVNRIATQLFVPDNPQSKSCSLFCGHHGQCVQYINTNTSYFCQCNQGYSGPQCETSHHCSCSSDSFCYTSSICVCPIDKFGSKCYLKHLVNHTCENNGISVPLDDRFNMKQFICLCKENFHGEKCEYNKSRIDIELTDEIIGETKMIYFHYITAFETRAHQRTTILRKVKYNEDSITLLVAQSYHILLVELINKMYYVVVLREKFIESEHIQNQLRINQRCLSINELFNQTLRSYSRYHRIKYYPYLCRQNFKVMCFYDENYMCICDQDRFSNCFTFNRTIKYDCQDENPCENGGQCFQDNVTCPSSRICSCDDCYYGAKCQFSTKGFVLSLDYILGYHIKPNLSLSKQPFIVKLTIVIIVLMFIGGLINVILSVLTFYRKKTQAVGCGIYLFISSWISIILISFLVMKCVQLIFSQMNLLTNRSWLNFSCQFLDMFIQVTLTSNDWLYGSVSIERVFTVIKSVKFNKSKSKQLAKWISFSIILFTILTHIHIPLYRKLEDDIDIDEKRTWCLIQYPSSINIYNSFINLFHFLTPFTINIISIFLIIISMARSRATIQPKLTFKQHFQLQFKQHTHHLITSCALILLALPRLIISFITGCMKSPRNSWLFLLAYLISFLPSMATFIVFVLPSKIYKKEFNDVIERTVRRIRERFNNN